MQKEPDHIRALDRGLQVIELLARNGHMSLAEIRHATGLPNPTLLRILGTLIARRWVRRNIVEGRYELSHLLGQIFGDDARAHPLAEIAAPALLDLKSQQAGWPSDVAAVMAAGTIEIVESTRLRGLMAPTRTGLGLRPSMVFSAHGRAVLAFSAKPVADRHMAAVAAQADRDERAFIETGQLAREIDETRQRGFGLRHSLYWAQPFDPGPPLSAMAVPVRGKTGLHGTISLVWIDAETSLDAMIANGGLKDLSRAAERIGQALDRSGVAAPAIIGPA